MKTIKHKFMIKIIPLLIIGLLTSFSPTANAAILMDFHLNASDGYPETSFKAVFHNFKDIIDGPVEASQLISPVPNHDPGIYEARFNFPDSTTAVGYMNKVGLYYIYPDLNWKGLEPGAWSGYPWDHYGIYTRPDGYFTLSGAPGSALAWGGNTSGQLGDGTTSDSRAPILPLLPGAATAVATGGAFNLALDPDGSVWAWGSNHSGQLGNGTFTDSSVPVRVKDPTGEGFLTGIVSISAGFDHSLALDKNGKVYGWGSNDAGQLGTDPQTTDRYDLPREIISTGIRAIAAGQQFSLALGIGPGDEGCVSAWGVNDFGQLGRGDYEKHVGPDFVTTGPDSILWSIKSIAAGWNHALALDREGKVWAWGKNEFGQLATASPNPSPIAIQSGPSDISAVSAGLGFSLAIDNHFAVWAWGGNWEGQLGDGTKTDRVIPVNVKTSATENIGGIMALSAGRFHSMALDLNGKPWTWGDNQTGALGRDPVETPESLYAISVQDYGGQNNLVGILDIAAGNLFSLALAKPGFDVTVSLSSSANPAVPGEAVTLTAMVSPVDPTAGTPTGTVFFKEGHTILGSATLADGQASFTTSSLAAGHHGITALFSGMNFTVSASPVLTELIAVPIRIVTTMMPPGTKGQPYRRSILHAGGYGPTQWSLIDGSLPSGLSLGNGIVNGMPAAAGTYRFTVRARNSGFEDTRTLTISIDHPGKIRSWGMVDYWGTLTNVIAVSAGDRHGVALDAEGKVWAWGNNEYGQLGNGQTCMDWPCVPVPVTVPIQPVGLEGRTFTQVVAGGAHSIALESNGNVWIWGVSDSNLPAASWTHPVPIRFQREDGSLLDGITAIALGRDHAFGLGQDGTVYMLGPHANRVKGLDGINDLGEIVSIAAWGNYALALARDGGVYEWGYYGYYDSDGYFKYVSRPFPTRVELGAESPLTNIVEVAAGEKFGMALDRDGRVWAWGDNTYGQLGQGASTPVWSQYAVQVKKSGGVLSDVVSISAGGTRCLALDARGSLWSWGNYSSLPYDSYTGNPEMGYVTGFSAGGELMAMILTGIGGDLNGDSSVDLADAILGLRLLSGAPGEDVRLNSAVTEDLRIGLGAVLYILQSTAGLRGRD